LVRRAETMLHRLTGRDQNEVRDALKRANGSVKLAVLLLEGSTVPQAKALLDRTGGQLRAALELARKKGSLAEVASPSVLDDALLNE